MTKELGKSPGSGKEETSFSPKRQGGEARGVFPRAIASSAPQEVMRKAGRGRRETHTIISPLLSDETGRDTQRNGKIVSGSDESMTPSRWVSAQDLKDYADAHPDEAEEGQVWHVNRQLFGAPGEHVEVELHSLARSIEEGKLFERGLGERSQKFLSAFINHVKEQEAAEEET